MINAIKIAVSAYLFNNDYPPSELIASSVALLYPSWEKWAFSSLTCPWSNRTFNSSFQGNCFTSSLSVDCHNNGGHSGAGVYARDVEMRRGFVAHVTQEDARVGIVQLQPIDVGRAADQDVFVIFVEAAVLVPAAASVVASIAAAIISNFDAIHLRLFCGDALEKVTAFDFQDALWQALHGALARCWWQPFIQNEIEKEKKIEENEMTPFDGWDIW